MNNIKNHIWISENFNSSSDRKINVLEGNLNTKLAEIHITEYTDNQYKVEIEKSYLNNSREKYYIEKENLNMLIKEIATRFRYC